MKTINYIFDLDGTVFINGRFLPKLEDFIRNNYGNPKVKFTVASSRAPRGVDAALGDCVRFIDNFVYFNGALMDINHKISSFPIAENSIESIYKVCCLHNIPFYVDYGESVQVFNSSKGIEYILEYEESRFYSFHNFATLEKLPLKVTLSCSGFRQEFLNDLLLDIPGISYFEHENNVIDIISSLSDKANCLDNLSGYKVAAGNDENDRKLLRSADFSILVGDLIDIPGVLKVASPDKVVEKFIKFYSIFYD